MLNLNQQMYINGQWKDTAELHDVINPATGEIIGTIPMGGAAEARGSRGCGAWCPQGMVS
ncbi:hypothetical protein JCM16418_614 [Paenibacillus pini JCM 16418]|uniref:Succinate-semialdehyde dehydrogenase n=1 Tax=Paenibacillus pini JCM 16418 TaxID=1236976 RepID=W7YDU0_9BACL|nr:hypothetical protein JCM16418_614 [Paenibacillus pini JCM 16418]